MHATCFLVLASLLIACSTGKPTDKPEASCSSEGLTCQSEEEKCCDGLTCLVSGDDRVRRCFSLQPSVEYDEEVS